MLQEMVCHGCKGECEQGCYKPDPYFGVSSSEYKSSSSSSSSNDQDCLERCGECAKRKRDYQGDDCIRTLKAYSIDTCLIEYRPRLINVPSKKFSCIDDAFRCLSPNKGGYVIKLAPGIHNLNVNVCLNVDYLHIIGDCCPFVGKPYINSCGPSVTYDPEYCAPCQASPFNDIAGQGPYTITVSGRKLIINGLTPPRFDTLKGACCNRVLRAVHRDGSLTQHSIKDGSGNTIIVGTDVGFGNNPYLGEGFYIEPNVIVNLEGETNYIIPTHMLKLDGIMWNGSGYLVCGTPGLYMDMRNCLETFTLRIHPIGRYYFTQSNVFTGRVYLTAASIGTAWYQGIVGVQARLIGQGNAPSSWRFCVFANSQHAAKAEVGSHIDFFGSQFVNNCIALSATNGAIAIITAALFCGNRFAMMSLYMSMITSYKTGFTERVEYPPIIQDNFYAMVANWSSMVIVTRACFKNNKHHAMIDSRTHTTAESVPVGSYGTEYSMVLDTANPSIVNEVATYCVEGDRPVNVAADLLHLTGHQSIISRSVVRGDTAVNNDARFGRGTGGFNSNVVEAGNARPAPDIGSGLGAGCFVGFGPGSPNNFGCIPGVSPGFGVNGSGTCAGLAKCYNTVGNNIPISPTNTNVQDFPLGTFDINQNTGVFNLS